MMTRYHLELEVKSGTLFLSWNHRGELSKIIFNEKSRDVSKRKSIVSPLSGFVPEGWKRFVGGMFKYFEYGYPMNDIPWHRLDQCEWTDFQKKVYRATSSIPHGETRSYSWVAKKAGCEPAARAVGQALKRNRLPILIPCHRVIASDGGFGGFMGKIGDELPELELKRHLIGLEQNYLNPVFPFLLKSGER